MKYSVKYFKPMLGVVKVYKHTLMYNLFGSSDVTMVVAAAVMVIMIMKIYSTVENKH